MFIFLRAYSLSHLEHLTARSQIYTPRMSGVCILNSVSVHALGDTGFWVFNSVL